MHKIRNFHKEHSTVGEWQGSGMGTAWYVLIGPKSLSLGQSGTLVKGQGSTELISDYGAQRACL
jgi:hypothetical protein